MTKERLFAHSFVAHFAHKHCFSGWQLLGASSPLCWYTHLSNNHMGIIIIIINII